MAKELTRNFMQSDIAFLLKKIESILHLLKFRYFENLTRDNKETVFKVKVNDLERREFSDLSVMIFDQEPDIFTM
jgi:cobalt-precorrin-7 (C5)-methyltransferase